MRSDLEKRCQLFVENKDKIKKNFTWQNAHMYPLSASIYTIKNMESDVSKMDLCNDLLREKTGIFSNFRGIPRMILITNLSLEKNSEEKMDSILSLYKALKKEFWNSEFLAITAIAIADLAKTDEYDTIVGRTRLLYNMMKDAHPVLTSREDIVFAALLAVSEFSDTFIEEEMEQCYQKLKPYFFFKNGVQSLGHVLVLGEGSAEYKSDRVMQLFTYLRDKGYKYGTNHELATLGVLALLPQDIEKLGDEIIEVNEFLCKQKGFGVFRIGTKQRLMYAGILVMADYLKDVETMQYAALHSVVSLIIAQQIAICASIAATTAASTSSSSSS